MLNRWISLCVVLLFAAGNVSAAFIEKASASAASSSPAGSVSILVKLEKDDTYGTAGGERLRVIMTGTSSGSAGWQAHQVRFSSNDGTSYSLFVDSTAGGTLSYTGSLVVWPDGTKIKISATCHSVGEGGVSETNYGSYEVGASGPPGSPLKQITYRLPANTGANPVNYQIWRVSDNVPVADAFMLPGAGARDLTATGLPADTVATDYVLKLWYPGLYLDGGGNWGTVNPATASNAKPDATAETVQTPAIAVPPAAVNVVEDGTTPTSGNSIVVPSPTVSPSVAPTPSGSGGVIWRSPPGSGGGLTDATFKEGIDKIVTGQSKLVLVAEAQTAAKGAGEAATAGSAAAGAAAKTTAVASYPSAPSTTGYTASGGAAPSMVFTLPGIMGGHVINVNPFAEGRFSGLADWFRGALAWVTLVILGIWTWGQVAEWTRGFSTVRQAQGNAVIGGTGAQATALIAAGIITTAIVVGTTALIGWSFGEISLPTMVAKISTNPLSGLASGSLWLLDQFFPLGTMLAALVARMSFHIFASSLFAGVATLVRFVVP